MVGFFEQSKDEHNRLFLDSEIKTLRSKIGELKRSLEPDKQVIRFKTISNYSWSQDDDLINIYLNLSDFKNVNKDLIKVELLDQNQTVVITVDKSRLTIRNLNHPVSIVDDKLVKITKNFIVINLKKSKKEKWSSLQKESKDAPGKSLPNLNPEEDADPSQSMMKLMKNLYETGDDEMKRTIAKAWSEKKDNAFM